MILKYLLIKRILFSLAIIIFCLSQIVSLDVSAALIVTPKNTSEEKAFFYKVKPGDTISESFDITNVSAESSSFVLQVNDISVTTDGSITLLQNKEENKQLASWTQLITGEISIQSNTKVNIPLNINIPKNAKIGEYGAGISLSVQSKDTSSSTIRNTIRKGLKLYIFVQEETLPILSSTVKDFNVLDPTNTKEREFEKKLNFWDKNNLVFSFKAEDTGNTFSVIKGKYTITYNDGEEKIGEFSTNLAPNIGEKEYYISTNLPYGSGKTKIKLDYTVEALNKLEIGETKNENISGSLDDYIDTDDKVIAQFRGIDKVQAPDYSVERRVKVAKNLVIVLLSIVGVFALRKAIKTDKNSVDKR